MRVDRNRPRMGSGPGAARVVLSTALLCTLLAASVSGQEGVGQVTLVAGAPRMVGEAIRPLQTVLSGQILETGETDAAGLLVEEIVFHVGQNTEVSLIEEPGLKRVVLERGFVVFYTDPSLTSEVVVETPFGRLTAYPDSSAPEGSGWFSVRHDPTQPNASPAVSTFAAMEGLAEVAGTTPQAGPYDLPANHRWRIVEGEVPGPPEEGDERQSAEELRDFLHREAAELLRAQTIDLTRFDAQLRGVIRPVPADVVPATQQNVIDVDASVQVTLEPDLLPPPVLLPPRVVPPVEEPRYVVNDPTIIVAGEPAVGVAQFVPYAGIPADPDWNQYLTAADGNPAFQPNYLVQLANGGFSYLQFAGDNAEIITNNNEAFLASPAGQNTGWANFTPGSAVADSGFDPTSRAVQVVTDGFTAIAYGEHLAGGGTIGGGGDPSSAFAISSGGLIQLNPDLPPGYPQLDQASDTTGLTVGGNVVSDQIAALGAGRNPANLAETGPQLVFASDSTTDSLGNTVNFNGQQIEPTILDLPGDRQISVVGGSSASAATPLASGDESTVGIQFAANGQTIAIIHHTGTAPGDTPTESDNFEIIRGDRHSIVQWRDDGRVVGADGQVLEFEDLNEDTDLRNELFAFISEEVNALVPAGTHTAAGPAIDPANTGVLRRVPGRLLRVNGSVFRRSVVTRSLATPRDVRSVKVRPLTRTRGALSRPTPPRVNRRHIGRVGVR